MDGNLFTLDYIMMPSIHPKGEEIDADINYKRLLLGQDGGSHG